MAAEHTALIGSRIKEAREAAHLTQHELADALPGKADGTQISKWERGVHRPGDDTLKQIADAVGKDLAWFHTRAPDKTVTPDLSAPTPAQNALRLDRIEQTLEELATNVRDILTAIQTQPDVGLEIHRAYEDLANRLGREVGKRPAQSRRATDRPAAKKQAAA